MTTIFKEITINSFEELTDHVNSFINHKVGEKTSHREAIYRGQSNSDWSLFPSIFREFANSNRKFIKNNDFIRALSNEKMKTCSFVNNANKLGFSLPGNLFELINCNNFVADHYWAELNNHDFIEALCLARHHGFPARYLDFSNNWKKALFFPAIEILYQIDKNKNILDKYIKNKYFSLWLLYKFMNSFDTTELLLFDVHTYHNRYINPQEATFLSYKLDRMFHSSSDITLEKLDLKKIFEKFATDIANKIEKTNKDNSYVFYPSILKINIPYTLAPQILNILDSNYRINRFTIQPNLDNIIKSEKDRDLALEFLNQIKKI